MFVIKIKGAAIISGSPGLKNASARKVRRAKDDNRAQILVTYGLPVFLDSWYQGELWKRYSGSHVFVVNSGFMRV